jgi:hypothetical protein
MGAIPAHIASAATGHFEAAHANLAHAGSRIDIESLHGAPLDIEAAEALRQAANEAREGANLLQGDTDWHVLADNARGVPNVLDMTLENSEWRGNRLRTAHDRIEQTLADLRAATRIDADDVAQRLLTIVAHPLEETDGATLREAAALLNNVPASMHVHFESIPRRGAWSPALHQLAISPRSKPHSAYDLANIVTSFVVRSPEDANRVLRTIERHIDLDDLLDPRRSLGQSDTNARTALWYRVAGTYPDVAATTTLGAQLGQRLHRVVASSKPIADADIHEFVRLANIVPLTPTNVDPAFAAWAARAVQHLFELPGGHGTRNLFDGLLKHIKQAGIKRTGLPIDPAWVAGRLERIENLSAHQFDKSAVAEFQFLTTFLKDPPQGIADRIAARAAHSGNRGAWKAASQIDPELTLDSPLRTLDLHVRLGANEGLVLPAIRHQLERVRTSTSSLSGLADDATQRDLADRIIALATRNVDRIDRRLVETSDGQTGYLNFPDYGEIAELIADSRLLSALRGEARAQAPGSVSW